MAARMRPRTLAEYIGQEHLIGPGKLLRRAIETDRLFSSVILWGPPGTGKTTLAQVIANQTKSYFETLSTILAGKSDLREVIDRSQERNRLYNQRIVLFMKEVVEAQNQGFYNFGIRLVRHLDKTKYSVYP